MWNVPRITNEKMSSNLCSEDEEKAIGKRHQEGEIAEQNVNVGFHHRREHVDIDGYRGGRKNFHLFKNVFLWSAKALKLGQLKVSHLQ